MSIDVTERLARHLYKDPDIHQAAFVASTSRVMGDVTLGQDASVWYHCVLRGDINAIKIGAGTNVQDGTIVHLSNEYGVEIGDYTTIGHRALIHGCKIGHECLIGMGATILDGVEIGNRCIIGACALVTKGTKIPDGSMVFGNPASVKRLLTEGEQNDIRHWAEKYIKVAKAHLERRHIVRELSRKAAQVE
ncbi:MAG: gamma carbonic anhydrase family protein [Verrucomicrobiales bacterium]|jgi:carbonic anhydrase/acetyltransferase-like protein (isoleucine patch superfamily)|nr:gamma carbonic anhydrase family protein [Verrucomicrobiales bacterium]